MPDSSRAEMKPRSVIAAPRACAVARATCRLRRIPDAGFATTHFPSAWSTRRRRACRRASTPATFRAARPVPRGVPPPAIARRLPRRRPAPAALADPGHVEHDLRRRAEPAIDHLAPAIPRRGSLLPLPACGVLVDDSVERLHGHGAPGAGREP